VKVDVKTLDGTPMTAAAAVQPLGSGLRIAPGFAASTTDETTGLATRIEAKYVRTTGRYVVRAVAVESTADAVEVNAHTLRQVTVQAIVQAAAPHCIALTLENSADTTWLSVSELSTRDGRLIPPWLAADVVRRGSSEARLDVVEILYGVAALSGQAPLRMIMDELGIPHRTASDWTQKARAAGRLEGMTAAAGRKANG
jgi:hypothetical protein